MVSELIPLPEPPKGGKWSVEICGDEAQVVLYLEDGQRYSQWARYNSAYPLSSADHLASAAHRLLFRLKAAGELSDLLGVPVEGI